MFTGIVEELGEVVDLGPDTVTIRGPLVTADLRPGDSVAVSGVCLTAVTINDGQFTADVMKETFDRSALGTLAAGDPVNLERAATATTRLGGHLVQGHVDGVGTIVARRPTERWEEVRVALPPATSRYPGLSRYVVEKGSIAVDGVSLTIVAETDEWFEVSLIPTTCELTTLGRKRAGDLVNLEVDVIAKYVEKQVAWLTKGGAS